MLPLCLGVDPAKSAGIALLEPVGVGQRPRLLGLRVVPGELAANAWAERAFYGFEGLRDIARARFPGRPIGGRIEWTPAVAKRLAGSMALSLRRGQLIQAAADAGFCIDPPQPSAGPTRAGFDIINSQVWPGPLGLTPGTQGDGMHRVAEAETLVECPPETFRGLGDAVVDAAEAVLIAAALARLVTGEWVLVAKKPRGATSARLKRAGRAA
jgi:hypothetical protein